MTDSEDHSNIAHVPVAWVSFFQMVRRLESQSGRRIGTDTQPRDEPVNLRVDVDANFPVAELAKWTDGNKLTDGLAKPTLAVSFFGLFGASGALPHHYSQLIADRARAKDTGLRDFLDIFNHRLLSFFYRCWEKHQYPIAFETAEAAGLEDTLTRALWALIGNRTGNLSNRLSLPDATFLYFAGHYANVRPSAESLRGILGLTFNATVMVEEFVGQWMLVHRSDQTQIAPVPLGQNCGNRLGVDAMAGQRAWDIQNRFRIRIGPLVRKRFLDFTPLGTSLRQLVDCARRYVGPQFDFDVQVVLKREEVLGARLGVADQACLGWNTWLGDWKSNADADDAIFELHDTAFSAQ